jgi:nucleoside-diphosphate-sugar epimerase
MSPQLDPVLVTGATGLIGGNVCRDLTARGRPVRALVRDPAEAGPIAGLGAELVTGDITDPDSVRQAARGCASVVHAAAVLGGTGQDLGTFRRTNATGTATVFDAAAKEGVRVVFTASLVVFDETRTLTERSQVDTGAGDPYTVTKREAFLDAMSRAESGQDIVVILPGATHGPAPILSKALAPTSFNRLIRGAVNGRMPGYPATITMPFSFAPDVASAIVSALDRGQAGRFYLAFGAEDAMHGVEFFNMACEVAGVSSRVPALQLDPDSPGALATYGQSMVRNMRLRRPTPAFDDRLTREVLGYRPTPVREALAQTVAWLRANDQIRERRIVEEGAR